MANSNTAAQIKQLLASADPVTDEVTAAAVDAFGWRMLGMELAELRFDSAVDEVSGGIRSAGGRRIITFEGRETTLEVGLNRPALVGQVVPPQTATIELNQPSAHHSVVTDELGRFTFESVPAGPFSLTCTTDTGSLRTEWIVL